MKKIISVILILALCLFAVGCSSTSEVAFDDERPWQNHKSEKCEYTVKQLSADGTKLGEGTYTTTLTVNPGENVTYTYKTEFEFTRADGGVDKITSESEFNRSLLCIKTSKETDFSGNNKKNNYRFEAYHDSSDPEKMIVAYEYGENFENTKTLSSRYVNYDNEYLFCFARAINVKSVGEIKVVNLYESLLSGSIDNFGLYYHAEDSSLTDFKKETLNGWGFDTEDVLACHKVSLRRMSAPYGTPIEVWYGKEAFAGGNAKVPVKIFYEAPKAPSGETDYTITYLLSSYSVED